MTISLLKGHSFGSQWNNSFKFHDSRWALMIVSINHPYRNYEDCVIQLTSHSPARLKIVYMTHSFSVLTLFCFVVVVVILCSVWIENDVLICVQMLLQFFSFSISWHMEDEKWPIHKKARKIKEEKKKKICSRPSWTVSYSTI